MIVMIIGMYVWDNFRDVFDSQGQSIDRILEILRMKVVLEKNIIIVFVRVLIENINNWLNLEFFLIKIDKYMCFVYYMIWMYR